MTIVFDCEIERAILGRGEKPIDGIAYCGGWRAFDEMGCAVVCTYECDTHLTQVWLRKQFPELQEYLASDETAGFNTRRFDIPLLAANGVIVDQSRHYDALEKIWVQQGFDPDRFKPETHGGWGLDAIMYATFGLQKSGNGAMAPIWWQTGERGKVVSYCCRDVWLEAMLVRHMLAGRPVKAAGKQPVTVPNRFAIKEAVK